MIRTKTFYGEDLDLALEEFEEYCEDAKLSIDDIISVNVIGKNADKDIAVVMFFDDMDD